MKRFSLPERVPFDVSEDNFTIAAPEGFLETSEEPTDVRERGLRERKRGGRGEREGDLRAGRGEGSLNKTRISSDKTEVKDSANRPGAGTQGDVRTLSASGGGSYYIYSFNGMLLAEYDINGNLVRDYIYVGGQLVAEFRPPNTYYYYTSDQINSTRIVTNNSGTVVYSAAYDPYGGVQKTWPSTYEPTVKFSGKERDGESGLDYFGARYYDKAQYRFISVDPITVRAAGLLDSQLWHLYSYCRNNPVNRMDPDGRSWVVFSRSQQLLYIYSKNGTLIGTFPASCNSSNREAFQPGQEYAFHHYKEHPGAADWEGIDSWGFFGFAGKDGEYGIHAGRIGYKAGIAGWEYPTRGCIRTTQGAMKWMIALGFYGDPVVRPLVTDDYHTVTAPAPSKEETKKIMKQIKKFIEGLESFFNFINDYFFIYGPIPPGAFSDDI